MVVYGGGPRRPFLASTVTAVAGTESAAIGRLQMVHTCGVRLSVCLRVGLLAGRRRSNWGATSTGQARMLQAHSALHLISWSAHVSMRPLASEQLVAPPRSAVLTDFCAVLSKRGDRPTCEQRRARRRACKPLAAQIRKHGSCCASLCTQTCTKGGAIDDVVLY